MKFLVTHDRDISPLLRWLMTGVLIAIGLYLPMDTVLHGMMLGFSPQKGAVALYGDGEAFVEPMLLQTLLLQVHIDLFMALFIVLILSAVSIRVLQSRQTKKMVTHLLGIFGLVAPLLLLGAYFSTCVWLFDVWYGLFLVWHLFAWGICVVLIREVIR